MPFLLKVLVFNVWFPKGEKEKWRWGVKGTSLLSAGSHFRTMGGVCNNRRGHPPLCLPSCDEKQQPVIRAQIPNIWRTGFILSNLAPKSCDMLLQEHVHSCLPCGLGWGIGSCYCTKLKLTKINCNLPVPAFPWKLQAFSRLQSSKIDKSDRFC